MFFLSKKRREEINKKQKNKKLAVIAAAVLVVLIASGGIVLANVHKCDDCSETIFGSGYYKEHESQGVLGSLFGSVFGDTESIQPETVDGVIICRECAMNNTSVKAELRSVDEFRR